MSQDWMIDVLSDLKKFAQQNGLVALAEQLDDTILLATAELKQNEPEDAGISSYAKQDSRVRGAHATSEKI